MQIQQYNTNLCLCLCLEGDLLIGGEVKPGLGAKKLSPKNNN